MDSISKAVEEVLPSVLELRHDLHAHPELAYEEEQTARRLLDFFEGVPGLDIRTGIAGTGLAVTLNKDKSGPCVGLRADMDALPIQEVRDLPWKSTEPGKMHACGHDGHMAMLAGAVKVLAGRTDELDGPVKFIFQPAEEGGGGAKRMCEEGVLNNPDVDAIFGLHNNLPDPTLKAGTIAYCPGPAMAGTGTFDIEILAEGGHAAFPHRSADPLYIGSCIVSQLQSLVSRRIDPMKSSVVSVCQFNAGTAFNIIPGKAVLSGTFRALDMDVLHTTRDQIEDLAESLAKAHGATTRIRCDVWYPVLINSPVGEHLFKSILEETGDTKRLQQVDGMMGGEDFAFYGEKIPSFFYYLPACPMDKDVVPICHHPEFEFNDDLLADGVRLHTEIGRRFARHWKS